MSDGPQHPWRLDTNERYRELIRLLISLSTASLLLPVFFARQFLAIPDAVPLCDVFCRSVFLSWGFLALSVISGIIFHFLSAKWARLAWGKPVSLFGRKVNESIIEKGLEITFWVTALAFCIGVALIVWFMVNF